MNNLADDPNDNYRNEKSKAETKTHTQNQNFNRNKETPESNNEIVDGSKNLETSLDLFKKPKKSVKFSKVDVYSFSRMQGFVSIPSDEDKSSITLGMAYKHNELENFNTIDEYLVYKRKCHLSRLETEAKSEEDEIKSYELVNNFLDTPDKNNMNDSGMEEKYKIISIVNNKEMFENIEVELPINMEMFCPILSLEERRKKLEECGEGIGKIDETESDEINEIKKSRLICGCRCKEMDMVCGENGDLCSCFANGISCQLDKIKYPCSCSIKRCKNPFGMKRFDAKNVVKHLKEVLAKQNGTELDIVQPESKENPVEETRQILSTPKRRKRKRNSSYSFGSPKRKKKAKLTTPTRQEFVKSEGLTCNESGNANSSLTNISNISNNSINTSQL